MDTHGTQSANSGHAVGSDVADAALADITAKDVRDACISTRTQRAYRSNVRLLSKWIEDTKSDASIYFHADGEINLTVFTPQDFEAFLISKRKSVGISTLNGYRSAICIGVKSCNTREAWQPSSLVSSGWQRLQCRPLGQKSPGKTHCHFQYTKSCVQLPLLVKIVVFPIFFLTTHWNLMCRSESVQTLSSNHLAAYDDIIGCVMHKSKCNQEGSGPKDPRHLYGNPFCPDTCWITALAVYLVCRPTQGAGPLFPGSQQKARFSNIFATMLSQRQDVSHFGTHSIWKGVATFACSGSTGGPSIASVRLRVGWSLGGVQVRYIRYESAGDQYLGRVVAGLPINGVAFAALPPHFADNNAPVVISAVSEMYSALSTESNLCNVLKLCAAALVTHGK
ncbi:TPA: LOW QUALITY PROTEIN: hypothetical protein N0F65_008601 [Lagenidium giganteum]|uniref:Core-binding (CB) domain-containing protein n=1 Tax=Lagenidium giganteum TaxID=4803 RepID=A0AAV2Z1C4_9STRA|nr:TPA: LOW QUALITY PROTEIN: hypothetical protein N0F65_008601 [Lagenidium giganteum]